MTYHGRIHNGVAVLDKGIRLPEGTQVLIQPAEPNEFWQGASISALAVRQRVARPNSLSDLAGDWPDEDSVDDFLAFVREARR